LLQDNLLESPNITPTKGQLALSGGAGLGLQLDHDVVARASERFQRDV